MRDHRLVHLAVVAILSWGGTLSCAEQDRPLLARPVLAEVVVADYASGSAGSKAVHPRAAARVADGRFEATFPAREELPLVVMRSGAAVDLSGMDLLRLDIGNAAPDRVTAVLTLVAQARDGGEATRAACEISLDPGSNACAFPLWNLRDVQGALLDRARITELTLAVKRRAAPAVLQVGRIVGQKLFADASGMRFFDFGDGAVAPGPLPVRADTGYAESRGYGLVTSEGVAAKTWQPAFALLGDGLDGKQIDFRVDLADGEYEAQVVAFGMSWQGARSVSYRITADGAALVDERITPERFRSFELQYYAADIFFDPRRTLFDQYHRGYFAPHRFDVRAHDGAITLRFEQAAPRALWLYPKAQAADGRALVDGCYGEEGHRLWLDHARVRGHKPQAGTAQPTEADRARGYTLFSRDSQRRVHPDEAPMAADLIPAGGLAVACAPGEFEPVTFVVRPLKDLGQTAITFAAPALNGQKSPIEIRSFVVKYMPQPVDGFWYEALPTLLYPYSDRELSKEWNCQYWATVHVPTGTPAGTYAGTITIAPRSGEKTVIPVALTVRPFDLPKSATECGMWNCGPWSNHQVGAFPDEADLGRRLLDAEIKDMAEHGLNGYQFAGPDAGALDLANRRQPLDFAKFDQIADALKKHGMRGRHLFSVLNLANYRLINKGVKEFSPEFNQIYVGIMTDLRDWMRAKDVHGVLQVTDECRETELNDWNRNRADTLKHLKLARQVEGLQTLVTLMGDTDMFNRPYTPLIPMMDVVSCHSWPRSDDQIFLTTVEKMADLWTYNNGSTRFAFGYYLWKSKALGHWQWVYSWETCDSHIPVLIGGDPSAAYAFPGGYLDSLKYENIREGIDDHRYLELLQATLAGAPADAPAALDAKAFLETLEKFLPSYPSDTGLVTGAEAGASWDESAQTAHFGEWRTQLSEYIAALREKRAAKRHEPAWAMFPKALVAEQRTLVCRLVDAAPTIDGKGDDVAWRDALETSGFLNLARGVRAMSETSVKMTCDGQRLFALIVCTEPKYGELKAYATERDDQCWQDDSVELFLDTRNDKTTYKHLIVNCLGTVQDSDTRDGLWNADIATAVSRGRGSWTVELSVTLASLGAEVPKPGTIWGANVCRNRQPQPPESSSWAFVGSSFHNAKGFGTLTFAK
ncbi:MAG: hypothetical protein H0V44_18045 [Planctomycetes bacterium]|nr:hypothetical protein [Planctomycetota bacterium]